MNFITELFNKNKINCPRCLGKGNVDWNDIERLEKELKWLPGRCAYCNGKGRVNPKIENKVPVDTTYLTSDLSRQERKKIINKDEQALLRGILLEKRTDNFIDQVNFLKSKGNLTPKEITEFYLISENEMSIEEKKELMEYIEKIIEYNRKTDRP